MTHCGQPSQGAVITPEVCTVHCTLYSIQFTVLSTVPGLISRPSEPDEELEDVRLYRSEPAGQSLGARQGGEAVKEGVEVTGHHLPAGVPAEQVLAQPGVPGLETGLDGHSAG